MLLASGQPIPHGRPYRYHLNGPVHMMTARKRVRPLPTYRLAERHSTDHSSSDSSSEASSDFHSDASSDPSSRTSLSDHFHQIYRVTFCGAILQETVSDEPHLEQDSDPEVQAEIDECFAYADALRDRGIDARVRTDRGVQMEQGDTGLVGGLSQQLLPFEKRGIAELEKMPNTRSGASMTHEEFEELVARRVAEELEARENRGNGNERRRNMVMEMENGNGMEEMEMEMETELKLSCEVCYMHTAGQCFVQWNSHKRTIGVEAAYAMNWVETNESCVTRCVLSKDMKSEDGE
ncbi:hypothetical protein Tco_0344124 [Tanacetum coccineum]